MTNPLSPNKRYSIEPIINEAIGNDTKGIGFAVMDDLNVVIARQAMTIKGPVTADELAQGLRDLAQAVTDGKWVGAAEKLVGSEAVKVGAR